MSSSVKQPQSTAQLSTPNAPGPSSPGGGGFDDGAKWLIGAPVVFVVTLLVLATAYSGAFPIQDWAPPSLFILVVLIAMALRGGGAPIPNRWLVLTLAGAWGLAAWAAASAAWGGSPEAALEGSGQLVLYAAVMTLPLVASRETRVLAVAGRGVIVGIAAIALYTLGHLFVNGQAIFLAGRLNGPIDYRNATALLFAIAFWPLIVTVASPGQSRALRGAAFGLAQLTLGLAFLTQSRGVLLGLACGAVVALAFGPDRVRRAWLAVLSLVLLAGASHWLLRPWDAFDGGHGLVSSANIVTSAWALLAVSFAAALAGFVLAVFDLGLRAADPQMAWARRAARTGLVFVVVAGIAAGLVAAGNPVTRLKTEWHEFKSLQTTTTTSVRFTSAGGQRYDLWRVALDEFKAHPLVGVGEGSYQFDYYKLRASNRNLDDPHGLLFQVGAELGVVGLALLALMFLGIVGSFATGWRSAPAPTRRLSIGLAAAGTTFVGQALVDWMWRIPGLTALGLLCLAAAAALVAREAPPAQPRRWAIWRRGLAGAALVAATVLTLSLYLSDLSARHARDEAGRAPASELADARTAARLDPALVNAHYLEASALETLGELTAARAQLLDAHRLEASNFVPIGLLGDFEARRGNFKLARVYYRRALAMDPLDVGLAQLAKTGGRPSR